MIALPGGRQHSAEVVRVLLAAALIFTVVIGGSESGALVTAVRAIAAILGALLIAAYVLKAPRDHDRVDQLVLAAFVLFLVACVFSSIPRLSFDSATTGLAYVATFYVARRAVADPKGREFAITVLGMVGTVVAVMHLVMWGPVWWQWLLLPDSGPPPFNLLLPRAQFNPVRASLLVALLLPATVLLARRAYIWPLGVIGTASALAVIVMSGSRTTWLAGGAALIVVAVVAARSFRRAPRFVQLGAPLVIAAGLIAVLPQLVARLATSSTIELRFAMWSDALGAWLNSSLTGTGPGTFASAFVLTGHNSRYGTYVPHAHNAPVQLLLETGVVGLLALALLATALTMSMRQRDKPRTAAVIGMTVFAVASLTEDPTQGSFLVVPLIIWAAILLPATVTAGEVIVPRRWMRALHTSVATGVALAVAATLAAAMAHDRAAAAADNGRDETVLRELGTATALDPSFPLYHRELGVWLLATDARVALGELETAVELNPGDQAAIRALAVARAVVGDASGSMAAARLALDRADLHPENALTLAYVGGLVGDDQAAWEGTVLAARHIPWVLAAPEWDAVFQATPKAKVIRAAHQSWVGSSEASYRNERIRAWLSGMTGDLGPPDVDTPSLAEAAIFLCRPDLAADALGRLDTVEATTGPALQARLIYERAFGTDVNPAIRQMMWLRNTTLARQAFGGVMGESPFSDYKADTQVYRRIPLALPGPIFPTGPSGLSAWLRDPVAAADVGAPGSPLAECR